MKSIALAIALAVGFSLPMVATAADAPVKAPTVQAQATPATPARPAAPAQKIDCTKVENKAHADCKVPAK